MKFSMMMVILGAATVLTSVGASRTTPATAMMDLDPKVLLRVPKSDYRRDWVQLGTYSVAADDGQEGAKEMHVVYAKPEDVDSFRRMGAFPDGTKIVKDVFETKTEYLTTGVASYGGKLAGRFVMVKDTSNRYASKSPLWGDGWGWAFYEGSETNVTVTTDYTQDCMSCHEPARDQDFLYTRGYPVLHSGKAQ